MRYRQIPAALRAAGLRYRRVFGQGDDNDLALAAGASVSVSGLSFNAAGYASEDVPGQVVIDAGPYTVKAVFSGGTWADSSNVYWFSTDIGSRIYIRKKATDDLTYYHDSVEVFSVGSATITPLWSTTEPNTIIVSTESGHTDAWLNGTKIVTADATTYAGVQATELHWGATHAGALGAAGSFQSFEVWAGRLADDDEPYIRNGDLIRSVLPEKSYITVPGKQPYDSGGGVMVTDVWGTSGTTQALLGSDGLTPAEYPTFKNGGMIFDGSRHLNLGNIASFAGAGAADEPFSVALFFYAKNPSGVQYLLQKGTTINTDLEWYLYCHGSSDRIAVRTFDPVGSDYVGRWAQAVGSGMPVAVVATYDASEANSGFKIYTRDNDVDDSDAGLGAYGGMGDLGANLEIGQNFEGVIVQPMIFDYALSPRQAKALAHMLYSRGIQVMRGGLL